MKNWNWKFYWKLYGVCLIPWLIVLPIYFYVRKTKKETDQVIREIMQTRIKIRRVPFIKK